MAKRKSFKSLPKKSQRAAFAQMDKDGSRRKGRGKSKATRLRGATLSAKSALGKVRALRAERAGLGDTLKAMAGLRRAGEALGQDRNQILRAGMNHLSRVDASDRALKKATADFKRANRTKRSLRTRTRAKQGRLF